MALLDTTDVHHTGSKGRPFMALMHSKSIFSRAAYIQNLPLSARMMVAFIGVTLLAVAAVGIASSMVSSNALIMAMGNRLAARADEEARLLGVFVGQQATSLQILALDQSTQAAVSLGNLQYPPSESSIRSRLAEAEAAWMAATPDSVIVRSRVAESVVGRNLRYYRTLAPDNVELLVTDAFGGLVAATDRTSDYDQSDEAWWQAARRGESYIGQPAFDESSKTMAIIFAVPVINPGDGAVIGVARSTYRFDALAQQVATTRIGESGGATLIVPGGRFIDPSGALAEMDEATRQTLQGASDSGYSIGLFKGKQNLLSKATLDTIPEVAALGWEYVIYQEEGEAMEPISASRDTGLMVALAALLGAAIVAALVANKISTPLTRLSAAARDLAAGDLSRRVGLGGRDEIGQLSNSFDSMAAALEQRVASEQEAQADRLRLQEEVINVQRETLKELATPLIPLNDRVLLLPLIGSIDRERADQIFQALLHGVSRHRARRVIIDLTGTPVVDASVAEILMRAAQGVRLLGAEVALTGISASLARTLVQLDLQLDVFNVEANLETALSR
jgi:anti-anti-sigma regulatory factor/HAMP domain-containing protein